MKLLASSMSVFATLLATFSLSPTSVMADAATDNIVTVYSSRKEHLIKPLFDRYGDKTGVKVRFITDKAGPLMARIKAEGAATPADIFMTVDAGVLWKASEDGLFQPLDSKALKDRVPVHLRSSKDDWFGLSIRARTLVYATDRVKLDELSTYEALADQQWQGRVCLRTSKKIYNKSLVATMINTLGEDQTEAVVKGWVANLAAPPFSNDTKTMQGILAGQCDVGVVNTYYYARLMKKQPDAKLALFWPNQQGRGVHINVSGAGVTKHAKNPEGARQLLEWLASEEAQGDFAGLNQEYPVNQAVSVSPVVASWGGFKSDDINVEAAGRLQAAAVKLMDRAGYK